MIPIRLLIEGLYSYQEAQEIVFEDLTAAGLFGIFGATGSGKSTILEAISYVLFGRIERLNQSGDDRNYNMMNLKSNRLYLEFDFKNYQGEVYRATSELKRNSKNFNEVRSPQNGYYHFVSGSWQPLEIKTAASILGMSYENFKRTMIIPQGQFREFLELGETDRIRMLEEVFRLGKYDLSAPTKQLVEANKEQLDQLNGRLQTYVDLSTERLQQQQEFVEKQQQLKTKEQSLFDQKEVSYTRLLHLKEQFDNWQKQKKELEGLRSQQAAMEQDREQLTAYKRLHRQFIQPLSELEKTEARITELCKNEADIQSHLKEQIAILKSLEEKKAKLEPSVATLSLQKEKAKDIAQLANMLELAKKIQLNEASSQRGAILLEASEQELNATKSKIAGLEKGIQQLKSELPKNDQLLAIGAWYQEQQTYLKRRAEFERKLGQLEEQKKELIESIRGLGFEEGHINQKLEEWKQKLSREEQALRQTENQLLLQQQLAHFCEDLEDGKACPLCGAIEHPHPWAMEDNHLELAVLQQGQKEWERQHKTYEQAQRKVIANQEKFNLVNAQLKVEQKGLEELNQAFHNHLASFVWSPQFEPDQPEAFAAKKIVWQKQEAQIRAQERTLEQMRVKMEQDTLTLSQNKDKWQGLQQRITGLKSNFDTLEQQLIHLRFSDYQEHKADELRLKREQLQKVNQETENQWEELVRKLNEHGPHIAAAEAQLELVQQNKNQLSQEQQTLEKQIEELLAQESHYELKDIKQILSSTIEVEQEEKRLQAYFLNLHLLINETEQMRKQLEGKEIESINFEEEQQLFEEAKARMESVNTSLITAQEDLKRFTQQLKEKEALLKEQHALQNRAEHLSLLRKLFHKKGFVNYISEMELRQLCEQANNRFTRMTRNQLTLSLGTGGQFEIIDLLNGGRRRSVKTLSGGQAFQVSLALALALAESVPTSAAADRNFFFIDEGFGTQDADAVRTVFETLLHLNKEDKIVGIISHVEALKDLMPIALSIIKDPSLGSRIYME